MKSCVYVPSRGKEVFFSLKQQLGYEEARDLFLRIINPKFIEDYKDSLVLDGEGVPSLKSILENPLVQKYLGDKKFLKVRQQEYTPISDTIDNYNRLLEDARVFNTNPKNNKYIGVIEHVSDSSGEEDYIQVVLHPRTDTLQETFNNQYSTFKLNKKLSDIFSDLGITVGHLEEAEVRAGRVGVTDFEAAKSIANDFSSLIRVANNSEGVKAIGEEFSHMLIGVFRNEPLIDRLINSLSKNSDSLKLLLEDEYDSVVNFHEGDMLLVSEEAVGQLLQKYLIEAINLKDLNSSALASRTLNSIISKFKNYDIADINEAIIDADNLFQNLAKDIIKGTLNLSQEDIRNSYRKVQFNALSGRVQKNIDLLKKAKETEAKRSTISQEEHLERVKEIILNLDKYINNEDTVEGIFYYIQEALTQLRNVNYHLDDMAYKIPSDKFKSLRIAKDYLSSYAPLIKDIRERLREEEEKSDNLFLKDFEIDGVKISVKDAINDTFIFMEDLHSKFKKQSLTAFSEFLKPFIPENILKEKLKEAEVESLEELLEKAPKDISFMDLWLDSMSESSDFILQVIDDIVKKQKDTIRNQTIKDSKRVQEWLLKAEAAGVTEFSWMFEKDSLGNKTGNYISEYNIGEYNRLKEEFNNYLKEKYGEHPTGENRKAFVKEKRDWFESTPIPLNDNYKKLSDVKKVLLEEYLDIKEEFDSRMPERKVDRNKAIQIRKKSNQRILESLSSPKTLFTNVKEAVEEAFLEKEDDDELLGSKGLTNFENKEVMILPTLYLKKLADPNEISEDVVSALLQYSYSSNTYSKMLDIIHPMEIGKIIFSEYQKVPKTRAGERVLEKLNFLGDKYTRGLVKDGESNISKKYKAFLESQVYGKHIKDAGAIELFGKKLNVAKATSSLLSYSSLVQLGFNWLSNVANITTGVAMQNIEAFSSDYFRASDLAKADKFYTTQLASYMKELPDRVKTNWLSLFGEYLNIQQDFDKKLKDTQKKNIVERALGANVAFLGQNAGDHWLYMRTALAMCIKTQVNVPGKGTMSLKDAFVIEDVIEGNDKIKVMKLPEGTTYVEDGNIVNVQELGRKIAYINQHLFGIYNTEDRVAANRTVLGRLLLMFKNWMKPQFNKRFKEKEYVQVLKDYEEGYYRTLIRIIKDLHNKERVLPGLWQTLSSKEKSQLKRCSAEVVQFLAVLLLAKMDWGDDDDDKSYISKLAEYTVKRAYHELGNLTPSHVMIEEMYKTVSNPIPVWGTIKNAKNLAVSCLWTPHWFDEMQSGPYKGMSTLEKHIYKSPLPIIAHYRQLERFTGDIEDVTSYYERNY